MINTLPLFFYFSLIVYTLHLRLSIYKNLDAGVQKGFLVQFLECEYIGMFLIVQDDFLAINWIKTPHIYAVHYTHITM